MPDKTPFNAAQRSAVTYGTDAPLLVLAGPGSGKTYTLTGRILYLIRQAGIPPEHILALTFTKSAALDMQRRFREMSGDRHYPVNFGTFHSVFYFILCQSHILRPEHLLSEPAKRNLLIPLLKEYYKQRGESFAGSLYNEAAELLSVFSFYKNTGDRDRTLRKLSSVRKEDFDRIFEDYEKRRISCGGFDFDDMLSECLRFLRTDRQSLRYWQERFPYLLLDEFQDINPVQYQAVRLLGEAGRIFAVGDDDQSIYGFRGSKPACLKRFTEDFKADRILLDINYRSSPDIVRASLAVIGENRERFPKDLRACGSGEAAASGERETAPVKVLYFPSHAAQEEHLIKGLRNISGEETCAVLFRTNMQMQKTAVVLQRAHIAYAMREKGRDLGEHFIVQDLTAYLVSGSGEADGEALARIVNKPARYVSREVLAQCGGLDGLIAYYAARSGNGRDRQIWEELLRLKKHLACVRKLSLHPALCYIRKVIGYEAYLDRLAGGDQREREEWQELLDWLTKEALSFQGIQEWTRFWGRQASPCKEPGRDAPVQLMTVHAAKGLEFDRVWIPDCNERIFPCGQMPDAETLEEERRIFYVAMTRAKKELELLCVNGDAESSRPPSRFLDPIPRSFHQIHSCQDTRQRHPTPFRIPRHPQ